jgi:Na+-transporting NADH:ubiquinone oxidoreductase subunit NqrC
MSTSTTVWIAVAVVVAILLIVAMVVAVNAARNRRRQRQAEEIREQVRLDAAKLERQEVLANETAAKARATQAEAEVKAAEAARLQDRAAKHHSDLATSREQLQDQQNRADSLDPKARTDAEESGDRPAPDRGAARGEDQGKAAEPANYRDSDNYRTTS